MNSLEEKLKGVFSLTEKKKYTEALELVDSVIDDCPERFKPYHEKAKLYARQKLWPEAIDAVSQAIELNNGEPMLYFSRARWHIQNQSFHDAYDDLTRLIELERKLDDTVPPAPPHST